MVTFNGKETVYDVVLGEYYDKGFRLTPSGDGERLTLTHNGKKIAEFEARLLTPGILRVGLENYTKNLALI